MIHKLVAAVSSGGIRLSKTHDDVTILNAKGIPAISPGLGATRG
jgi:hypothetical protein